MTDLQSSLGWLWSFLFMTVSMFFVFADRRHRGRGFMLLAGMNLAVSINSAADAFISYHGPSLQAFIAARIALLFGLLAGALNTHFLVTFFDAAQRKAITWVIYVLVGGGAFVIIIGSSMQLPRYGDLRFPMEYRSPSAEVSAYFLLALVIFTVFNFSVLYPAMKLGKRPARGMFIISALSAPAAIGEAAIILFLAQRWYLIEGASWVYGLIVIGSFVSEFHGTEGLLKQTTSNLAARTAELQHSYAEIDLMASELSRKQQLAAVGELAAAIAHEVRNPLAIIMNAVSGMKRQKLSPTDRETLLDIVNEESERLNKLVAELLRFARPVTAARSPISLYDICARASEAAPDGYQLKVQTSSDDDLGPVLVDPGLFRLALDNLIANSCQAMPDGGTIALTVRSGHFSDGTRAAAVDVIDAGQGMRPDELVRAKKPFFTTKPRGTGLGIPIAEKIVEAHGGEMELRSNPGQGTTVTIMLPLENELQKVVTYSETLKTVTRRRLRSIPPVQVTDLQSLAEHVEALAAQEKKDTLV